MIEPDPPAERAATDRTGGDLLVNERRMVAVAGTARQVARQPAAAGVVGRHPQ
jgi:hypothetical protein